MSEPWHLRRELSIGTIISLLILGTGSVAAFTEIKSDVSKLKDEPKVKITQVTRIEERQQRLQKDVEEIKQKVDRLPAIEEAIKSLSKQLDREREERRNQ